MTDKENILAAASAMMEQKYAAAEEAYKNQVKAMDASSYVLRMALAIVRDTNPQAAAVLVQQATKAGWSV